MDLLNFKTKIFFEFSFLFVCQCVASLYAQPVKSDFNLKGKIGIDTGMIYLTYYGDKEQRPVDDSAIIYKGNFRFKGNITQPAVAFISLDRRTAFGPNATNIFLEPSEMNISLEYNNFAKARLIGSGTQTVYEGLEESKSLLTEKYLAYSDILSNERDTAKIQILNTRLKSLDDSLNKIDYNFFSFHPKSYLTAYLLQYHIRDLGLDSLILFYNNLGEKLQNHIVAKSISEKISQKKAGSIGSIAKTFVAKDVKGNYIISRLLRGKYVLLDFWASWCIPCRKNNPHLIDLYNKYKQKKFIIIGVADNDSDTSAWKKAIQKDNIGIWNHILRGLNKEAKFEGLNSSMDVAEKYGVGVLPTMILINSEGIIVGRYQDELDELDKMLASVFK